MDSKTRAEMQQMMDMMKNYKNRLFLANHGKRSVPVEEDSVYFEEDNNNNGDEILDEEELARFFAVPNGFFFSPKPIGRSSFYKRFLMHLFELILDILFYISYFKSLGTFV